MRIGGIALKQYLWLMLVLVLSIAGCSKQMKDIKEENRIEGQVVMNEKGFYEISQDKAKELAKMGFTQIYEFGGIMTCNMNNIFFGDKVTDKWFRFVYTGFI